MANTMNDNNSQPPSSSLLTKALGMPSLRHKQNGIGGSSSVSSSTGSPSAAAPCAEDFEDNAVGRDKESNHDCVPQQSPPLENEPTLEQYLSPRHSDFTIPISNILPPKEIPTTLSSKSSSTGSPSAAALCVKDFEVNALGRDKESNHDYVPHRSPPLEDDSTLEQSLSPRHSDFTIPISNILPPIEIKNNTSSTDSPEALRRPSQGSQGSNGRSTKVRSILGNTVGKKYHLRDRAKIPTPKKYNYGSIPPPVTVVTTQSLMAGEMTPLSTASASKHQQQQQSGARVEEHAEDWQSPPTTAQHNRSSSRMIPRFLPTKDYSDDYDGYYDEILDNGFSLNHNGGGSEPELKNLLSESSSRRHFRKSVHAQSLVVGLAFMVVWLPNNAMAPNLTQMAGYYGMNEAERDLYLGSYCALALGVFCLPLSGLIGFMADFYSRKHLFVACCVLGGLSAAWSGWAPNFTSLFLARLCNGGCMSGSVPVAFSLLGDLFSKEERNAASSGLTSMMGLGILLGQVYAGQVGPLKSWQYPFYVSAIIQLGMAFVIALWVEEPVRGGKEKALQNVFKAGIKYERQLTLQGFYDAMRKNASNWILLWQGFLTSLPWGIVFVFLNDYLSQEKGFSVQEATFLVMLFGVGCAFGGVTGGYLGQMFMKGNRSNLPLYMAATTFLGIFPFLALLNSNFPNHNGFRSKLYSVLGGCIASLPSVNVRPCIINVNPPESRGAALTAANLFVTLGRGMGPSCITLLGSIFDLSRQSSFNMTLFVFWTISAIQLLFLAKTLPKDQDAMEEELLRYAAAAQAGSKEEDFADEEDPTGEGDYPRSPVRASREAFGAVDALHPKTPDRKASTREEDELLYESIISSPPAQYMTMDGKATRESLEFVKVGIQEFADEITMRNAICRGCDTISPCESHEDILPSQENGNTDNITDDSATIPIDGEVLFLDEDISGEEMQRRRKIWKRRQQQQ